MRRSCSCRGWYRSDRRSVNATEECGSSSITLLTAVAFAVFIVADREEWETRDIRPVVPAAKVFPLFLKAVYPRKRRSRARIGGWSRVVAHPGEWTDRGKRRREMGGRCLTTAGTWEKLQSGIMKYIARINVARDTSQRYFSIARGYLLRRTALPRTRLSLAASEERADVSYRRGSLQAASEERADDG